MTFRKEVISLYEMGRGRLQGKLNAAYLCKKMGWKIQDFREQPAWFINDLFLLFEGDAAREAAEARRANAKANKGKKR